MKTNKEIAQLLFEKQEDFETIVRAMNLSTKEFFDWVFNTERNLTQMYWTMGYLGMNQLLNPKSAAEELHGFCTENKKEILENFNYKFNVSTD